MFHVSKSKDFNKILKSQQDKLNNMFGNNYKTQ
jgi:hypothetical protein